VIQLPHKLWQLLEIALHDVKAVEAKPEYTVNMIQWHTPRFQGGDTCAVCAAGCVMISRLGVEEDSGHITSAIFHRLFGAHNAAALCAIDELRDGQVGAALGILIDGASSWCEASHDPHKLDRDVEQYHVDPLQWHSDMDKLLSDLKEADL